MDHITDKFGRIRQESAEVRREIRRQTVGYIVTALGLVAGLAWNEAIKSLIDYFFPIGQNSISAKFIYAAVITLVVVIASVYVIKLVNRGTPKGE